MIETTAPGQLLALSMNGGDTKYFIPPPPIEAQLGRLPARHAMANPAIHRALRINMRMWFLLVVGQVRQQVNRSIVTIIPRPHPRGLGDARSMCGTGRAGSDSPRKGQSAIGCFGDRVYARQCA
jgi:hypothetical protein